MSIATSIWKVCPFFGLECSRRIDPIFPQYQFNPLPFYAGAAVLLVIGLALLAIIGGRSVRIKIIMALATPAIFIIGKSLIAGVYVYSWTIRDDSEKAISES